jgi:death on curing protein
LTEPVFLELDEIIEIHHDQIRRYGGHPGIGDIGILKSTVAMPCATFDGNYLHTDIYQMAAAYLFHIVRNHPFIDGNKRTGTVAAIVFLLMNGIDLDAGEDDLEKIVLLAAEGKIDKEKIARFFESHTNK